MTETADDQDAQVPDDGRAVQVLLDDWARFVWWGTDGDVDRVATADGQVLTWATVDACRRHARQAGWSAAPTGPSADVAAEDTVDGRSVQTWLNRPGMPLDPVAGLTLWNLQWDLVATRTGAYPPLNSVQARCHRKLTVANIPWLAGVDTYRPRWTAAELRCLRAALGTAVHTVRAALRPESRT
ncbi:hypothetical protein TEK04_15755 [Klenkia sp. LSe6-5]|uniref:Uncharacterized protein n=1 Tax=Klenkia sesuvii TaxID=3103137 RepID=A0ABU8DYU3_9ACTN